MGQVLVGGLLHVLLIFSILFDVDLSPFDFESHDIFNFVLRNFKEMELIYHENALEWLQV